MAAVSYLQNIDTRPVEYKPYKLPWQGFMQEFSAKTQYFGESAAMVQQAYKNVLGLDPLFAQNKEYLKNFLDQATNDLSKIVKSDMTVSDNAVNAANVFKPIFDTSKKENRLLLTDSELNKFYKSESQKAQQARTTKNGAGWNRNNQFYMESQYQKYRQAAESGQDPATIEDHYAKRKGFIPYYDVLPDLEKIKKLCHEDSASNTGVNKDNYLMLETHSVNGVSSAKMQDCLGFLPDAAKQQIGINSYANYFGNKEGLMSDYKSYFVDNKKAQYDAATFKLAAAAGYKGKDPQKLAEIAALKALQEQKELEYNNGLNEWNNMLNGKSERDYIEDNYDNISSVVGNVKFTERGAKAMSWQEIENKLSANAAGIAQFKQQGDIYMQGLKFKQAQTLAEQNFGYDMQLAQFKGQIDLMKEGMKLDANGNIVSANPTNPVDAELLPVPVEGSMDEFQGTVKASFDNMTTSIQGLSNSVSSFIDNNPNLTEKQKQELKVSLGNVSTNNLDGIANFMDTYDKMGIDDPMIEANIKVFTDAKKQYMRLNNQQKDIEKGVQAVNQQYRMTTNTGVTVNLTDNQMRRLNNGEVVRGMTKAMLPQGTFNHYMRNVEQNEEIYQERLKEAYKTKWVNSTKYYYTPETKAQTDLRKLQMREQFAIPEGYEIVQYRTDKDGNAVFQLSQEVKDEDGNKSIKVLNQEEMQALDLPNLDFESFGGPEADSDTKKGQKKTFFKASGFRPAMTSYINPELQQDITMYTSAEMPEQMGTWADGSKDLEVTSSTGKEWKVRVGKVPDNSENKFRPIYKTFIKTNGVWKENPNPLYSIEQVSEVIENKKW